MSIEGEANSRNLAAALNLAWRWEQNIWHRGGPPNPTTQEIEEVLRRHPGIRDSVGFVGKVNARAFLNAKIAAVTHYLFSKKDADLADEFYESLATGAGLNLNDPILQLRERLYDNKRAKAKVSEQEVLALVIKAWNNTRSGHRTKTLRWQMSGPAAEEFPRVE